MCLVLSRRPPAVLALQPCAVRTICASFLVRTDREDNIINALMLPVICSGSAEAARLANARIGTAVLCGSTTVHAARALRVPSLRTDWKDHHSRLAGRNELLVSTTDVCTPLSSPLIRWCEVPKQRSGAYPRSRTAIRTAQILIRKLQRYMYLLAHGVVPSGINSICSALPLVEFWY